MATEYPNTLGALHIILFLSVLSLPARAQTEHEWDELMQQMAEEAGVDEDSQQGVEAQIEQLTDLHEHPLDLNSVTREQLLALPFLSERAVDALLDYRTLNGPLRSMGELLLIGGLDTRECRWLRLCATVGEAAADTSRRDTSWWGRGRHELLARTDIPLYNRAGWKWQRGIAQRWRYTWQQGRHLDAGLRAENDAGEPLFNRDTPAFDSYGGHLMLHDWGAVQTAIVGDYRVGFGQGLVINNGLQLGKLTTGLWRSGSYLRPHRSTDEVHFLRGAAATIVLGCFTTLTAFYSRRKLDATVSDSNTVASINTTGLHRTATELAHKGTLTSQTAGMHIGASLHPTIAGQPHTLHLGATALYQHYDHNFRQGKALYRRILPDGYQFGAASVDYTWQMPHITFRGETARNFCDRGGGWATQNRVSWRFSSSTQLTALHRFYGMNYYSDHASAYGENSRVQNESGVALLLDADRVGPVALRAFFDYFYHPWPRYTMTRQSDGWEALLQATYQPRRGQQLLLRYRVKSKELSDRRYFSHQLRTAYVRPLSRRWTAQATAHAHCYHAEATSTGLAIAPRMDYTSPDARLRFSVLGVLFRTDDFQSRLFLYEPSLLQSFGLQQLYGRGQRLATTLRWQTRRRRWTIQGKLGITHYTDRTEISSGPLLIRSSWKPDLQLLLRWQVK